MRCHGSTYELINIRHTSAELSVFFYCHNWTHVGDVSVVEGQPVEPHLWEQQLLFVGPCLLNSAKSVGLFLELLGF